MLFHFIYALLQIERGRHNSSDVPSTPYLGS